MLTVSVDWLRRRLRWPHIRSTEKVDPYGTSRVISILPEQEGLGTIDLIFGVFGRQRQEILHSVHYFSSILGGKSEHRGHCHYERWDCEARNVIDAVREVARLVSQQDCWVECVDEVGKYWSSQQLPGDGVPDFVPSQAHHFRRVFFNRAPEDEVIDRSLYLDEGYGLIARALHEPIPQ
ncbi:MAG: hypothetical protein K0U98_15250 [Deltaproteobacteria bacterium]|nr:hypothetical protein [Deltaproteobacteria bacterium]